MFFSLNKKFIYTIAVFFFFTATLFVYTFYLIYGAKFAEEQKLSFLRNQQFVEILHENIKMRSEIIQLLEQNPQLSLQKDLQTLLDKNDPKKQQETLSTERKRAFQALKSYNDRYQAIGTALRIVISSAILIVLAISLLWLLIRRWVIAPIDEFSRISDLISSGDLSHRINLRRRQTLPDEFDKLSETFNHMIFNLNKNIQEIKAKEMFLQSLIDNIPDGIRVIDENYNIIIANKEYYRQINETSSSPQPITCYKSSQNLAHPCPSNLFTCPVREIKENKAKNIKSIQQFSNFPNRHLFINAAPLHIENNLYIVESIRDLSEDIRFSHQQKLSSLGFLATSVAHEMKNNLGAVRIIIEGLLNKFYNKKPYEEEAKKYLELIHSQIINSINIPERLLKLSRINSENNQTTDIIAAVKEVTSLLDYEATRNGISINLKTKLKEALIKGSDAEVKMVIINLFQNSFKAINGSGTITIEIKKNKEKTIISIQDTGKGIPQDKINHVFEPFFSGENPSSKTQGTGLGLSIAKSVVEKFNGTINVESKVNVGTCFTMEFPAI